ncbi:MULTISPECIES: hypothetical protein [Halorubrum]|uniref:Uncharacterized protein n=1 Tax=Halorubrum hochstenium ATCC 700873 TaxID=1227481 RepID=M0F7C0_9EURY|nr:MULTISPECIES: hypothetical protein [Halorubrum]ELZ55916.1 hypothetical protein C467_09039 [Halorubrum hochstenium ATCC 700873]
MSPPGDSPDNDRLGSDSLDGDLADSDRSSSGRLRRHVLGDRRPRRLLLLSVGVLLAVASVAFLAGASVGLYAFFGWLVIAPAIAVAAGFFGAGLASTVGSLGLIAVWGYTFPPLVGLLTGEWTGGSRYTYPRMLGFAHGSARAELMGGLESVVEFGLPLAVALGAVGYAVGIAVRLVARRAAA